MARTQKNKATALHLGLLKARLAKLRRELITPKGGGGGTGEGELFVLFIFTISLMRRNLIIYPTLSFLCECFK